MATFCLIPKQVDKFLQGLTSGEIDPVKLSEMNSRERRGFLENYVGKENAQEVNAQFESKLLLKNKQEGFINWAKKISGISKEAKRDLVSRIEKMDKILTPKEEEQFLNDLASKKLGADISFEEAQKLADFSKKIQDQRLKMNEDFSFKNPEDAKSFGDAVTSMKNYVNQLKGTDKISLSLTDAPGISKSIKSTLDDSAIFRQGWKTMLTHPATWAKGAVKSFDNIAKEFGGKNVMDEIMSDKESRQNNLNGNYKKMKLAIAKDEEAYPSSLPEKIPILGRAFKASETAYTGFVYKLRMDLADKYIQIAKDQKTDLTDKELESIGSMVNSLTGRGNLGKYEGSGADALNSVFFSPRNVKSQFDTLGHVLTGAGGSNFVRKQAAINLVKIVSGIAAIMTISNAVAPGSAETDPNSSDFGKIRVGNTRFDITGGMSSLVTLASRIRTQKTKSSVTGKTTPINSGEFGAKTGKDVIVDYLTNKLSPVGQVALDLLNQKDRNGNKLTIGGELSNLALPLPIATFQELQKDPNSANIVASMIADGLGISTNTYNGDKNWSQNPNKSQQAFLQKVGQAKFDRANTQYNKAYVEWHDKISATNSYKKLSPDAQSKLDTQAKSNIEDKVMKNFGFAYNRVTNKTSKDRNEAVLIKRLLPK